MQSKRLILVIKFFFHPRQTVFKTVFHIVKVDSIRGIPVICGIENIGELRVYGGISLHLKVERFFDGRHSILQTRLWIMARH